MTYTSSIPLPEFDLWKQTEKRRTPLSFDIEVTARCNLNCRHCYINLPASDYEAKKAELTLDEIEAIAKQAVSMGTFWCLISGGEPLLRPDFPEIYMLLKRLGLLVSVFTNATLVNADIVALFKRYPPRSLEVTVYGVSPETYERVSGRPGSHAQFRRGLNLLLDAGIPVTLKTMAIQSNAHELPEIATFCREHTAAPFRFDPQLHLRYDGNPIRNAEILSERLSPEQVVAAEKADPERSKAVEKSCQEMGFASPEEPTDNHIFRCGAGLSSFSISYDGHFRLCSSLAHPDYDLRTGNLSQAWSEFVPSVRDLRSQSMEFLNGCKQCALNDLCLCCPAHAALETEKLDGWVESFCQVAHARFTAHSNQASEK